MSKAAVYFVVPSFLFTVDDETGSAITDCAWTGGSIYERRVFDELVKADDVDVTAVAVGGVWPLLTWAEGTEETRAAAAAELLEKISAIPDGGVVLFDGLFLQDMEPPITANKGRLVFVGFVHHPCSLETGFSDEHRAQLLEMEKVSVPLVDFVIANSQDTLDKMVEMYEYPPDAITAIIPGVEAQVATEVERPPMKDESGGLHVEMLCISNFAPRKGYTVLVRALTAMNTEHSWRLRVVGNLEFDPEETERVKQLIEEGGLTDKIELMGAVEPSAVPPFYASSHVFVFPSLYESYGMVVAEAAQSGLPIISSNGGALSTTAPAKSSILVESGSVEELTAALETFMNNEEKRNTLIAAAEEGSPVWTWDNVRESFVSTLTTAKARV